LRSTVISNKDLPSKISRYCLGWLFLRDKGHQRLPTPPVRIAWLNDSFPYIFFVVRWCSMFDVRCSCSMFDVRVDVRCSMFDVRCSIENAYVFYHPVDSRSTKSNFIIFRLHYHPKLLLHHTTVVVFCSTINPCLKFGMCHGELLHQTFDLEPYLMWLIYSFLTASGLARGHIVTVIP
jgi:hypothetical protein